jgi:glycosyltransferase involved in cell wall biosynthesis
MKKGSWRVNILLASATPYLPQVIGGLEIHTDELALELNRRGHETAVLARLSLRDAYGMSRYVGNVLGGRRVASDSDLGYKVFRARRPCSHVGGIPLPDVVVVQNGDMVGFANDFASRGILSVAYLHGLGSESRGGGWSQPSGKLPFHVYVANSRFTAERFCKRFGVKPHVIAPIFRRERYEAAGERRYTTFINPVPEKGVELAFAIAGVCPDIRFRFVRAWRLDRRNLRKLNARIARLPNVELVDAHFDMRSIYGATRVLLAPSVCEETWGRVATEAQFSGVPVLGSNSGGTPEAIGPGGTIIARNAPPVVWADELRQLWYDQQHYAEKSIQALAHSRRPGVKAEYQVDTFLAVIRDAMEWSL